MQQETLTVPAPTTPALTKYSERPVLRYDKSEWKMPLLFMLSMSLVGLEFVPAILFIAAILIHQFRHDRYNFVIMLTIFFGGYGLASPSQFPVKPTDLCLTASVILAFIYRKNRTEKCLITCIVCYIAILIFLATYSLESLSVQMLTIRNYMSILYFIVPVACFAGRRFDIQVFMHKAVLFVLIMGIFYLVDFFILCGNVLVPQVFVWGGFYSTFYAPIIDPLSFSMSRKYPSGLCIFVLAIFPISRYYRLAWWQWLILVGAVVVGKTITLLGTFVIAYIFFMGKIKTLIKWSVIGLVGAVGIYFVDEWITPKGYRDNIESRLRIKSTVDQFTALAEIADDEDLARFASGRMAQILPKFELVKKEKRQWTGLGFLHLEHTKIPRYIIYNEYYNDWEQREELAGAVENVPATIYIFSGYGGLIAHAVFWLALWLIVRKKRESAYFTSVLLMCLLIGMNGMLNTDNFNGLGLIALSLAAVLLTNKDQKRKNYYAPKRI
ncbi:MAG: hypothetical protein K2F91_03655 [Muribaculaceae bacterium]|nr:hypothetical protein [Muribaculaceae bacterium]